MEAVSGRAPAGQGHVRLIGLVMGLFFAFGFCTVLVDTLIPKLKATFALNYAEVMLTQFCFFGAYFIVSLPASWLLGKIGYLQGVTVGLVLMAVGALLFTPAAHAGVYEGFLAALFILASGVTIVQVASNPLAATAGDPDKAPSRLTLAQAFNSLATTVGPLFGSAFILSKGLATPDAATLSPSALIAARQQQAQAVQGPFLAIAGALLVMAVVCWLVRGLAPRAAPADGQGRSGYGDLLRRPRLMLGTLSIFLYVGAEVSIGSAMANYLMSPHALSAAPGKAGAMVSLYWGGAMVGRFIGFAVLRKVKPGYAVGVCACGALVLVLASVAGQGLMAAAALLLVGLCNAIMFPTIFTLAIEGLGDRAAKASGMLGVAIVGGAAVPMITGLVADRAGLTLGLLVPAACYVWIAIYGWVTGSGRVDRRSAQSPVSVAP
jgi:FHS family L-fucose permease-like MFS transporter